MRPPILLLAVALGLTRMAAANTTDHDPLARVPSHPAQYGNDRTAADVLVVRDFLPWGGDIVPYFTAAGANVTEIATSMLTSVNLADYCLVFVTGGTLEPTSIQTNRLNNAVGLFNAYLQGGGHMLYQTGTWGATLNLPGGVTTELDYQDSNTFTGPGYLSAGMPFPVFDGNAASHDQLTNLPGDAQVLITDLIGNATAVEYMVGSGIILAMSQPMECYIPSGACEGVFPHMVTLLENAIGYIMAAGNCEEPLVDAGEQPAVFALSQNAPNPFNPATSISFTLPEAGEASLKIFDMSGREVATLVNGMTERGEHTVTFDAGELSTGVYVYTLQAGDLSTTRKMLLVK